MRWLIAIAILFISNLSVAADLKLERTVLMMRHGIRPPFVANPVPEGVAAQAWPSWDVPYAHLTHHGAGAISLLAKYDRADWAKRGLLKPDGCPARNQIAVVSDTDQRTIRTGDVWLEAAFAGCGIKNTHGVEGQGDPMFRPLDQPTSIDSAKALAASLERNGGIAALRKTHQPAFDKLGVLLGCCSVKICAASNLPAGCKLSDLPGDMTAAKTPNKPRVSGILDYSSTAAQTLLLEYLDGKPMSDVGWGRAKREDIEEVLSLAAMKADLILRPAYVASFAAGPVAEKMLAALQDTSNRVTLFVGHDTNIGDLSGFFDFEFHFASYAPNTVPPGGAFGFELLTDASGDSFVRAFIRSQTMDQMRNLDALSEKNPPPRQIISINGCGELCPLPQFAKLVAEKISRR